MLGSGGGGGGGGEAPGGGGGGGGKGGFAVLGGCLGGGGGAVEGGGWFEGFGSGGGKGVDKPVLNVFRMAALLSGNRVRTTSEGAVSLKSILASGVRGEADVDALATRDGNRAGVLLWNYHDDDKPADGSEVKLTVTGLPSGVRRVLVEHYRID